MDEVVEMTYREIERYLQFYSKAEAERFMEIVKAFSLYNSESTMVAIGAAFTKGQGSSVLRDYARQIEKRSVVRDQDEEDEDEEEYVDEIDDKFERIFGDS